MTFIEKLLIIVVLVLIGLVHTVDYQEQGIYITKQCELTPQWSKCHAD